MDNKRILIIDDDIELCEELIDSLIEEGYSAESTQDPVKGISLMRDGGYDVILLDYRMPLLSGVDILKKLKADNVRKRIFIVSGRPSIEHVLKAENLSDMVSGIIPKPINFELLLEQIKKQ